jgi:Flp pilus assembly protein TadD
VLARLASAREAWAEGEQQEALEHLDAALAAEPERPEVLTELGSTMGILGRYEEADRYLRQAKRLAPGDVSVDAQLAIILFRKGLYAAAELELRGITERDPSQADALFYRGEALNRLGRADEALDVLTRVVELEPKKPRAYQLLGMLYDRKAMPELATAMYRKARELGRR